MSRCRDRWSMVRQRTRKKVRGMTGARIARSLKGLLAECFKYIIDHTSTLTGRGCISWRAFRGTWKVQCWDPLMIHVHLSHERYTVSRNMPPVGPLLAREIGIAIKHCTRCNVGGDFNNYTSKNWRGLKFWVWQEIDKILFCVRTKLMRLQSFMGQTYWWLPACGLFVCVEVSPCGQQTVVRLRTKRGWTFRMD